MAITSRLTSTQGKSRSTGVPGHAFVALAALSVALVPAFVFAPGPLASSMSDGGFGDQRHLIGSFSESFVGYWSSGDRNFSPGLERVVDYWVHYHVVKAVIAATLLAVLTAFGVLLWKAFVRAGGFGAARRAAIASAGAAATALGLISLAAVMANIQGAIAPLSSLLSMLPMHSSRGALADTLGQVRRHLADYPNAGNRTPPAVEVMVGDFSRYHLVIAVAAPMVAVVLIGLSVVSWRRFARTEASDRRARRIFRSFGLLWALLSLTFIVLAVANVSTAADPAPALLAFFTGGW
ncbi:hypothetical protein ACGFX4_10365 [Kitasatospora sp. NPDC048365]|uniref:hypothetical protein n=1 Tax=Kitasatospora sp. NPDC048365 TaxID=3364050 RepID=UPI00371E0548